MGLPATPQLSKPDPRSPVFKPDWRRCSRFSNMHEAQLVLDIPNQIKTVVIIMACISIMIFPSTTMANLPSMTHASLKELENVAVGCNYRMLQGRLNKRRV